jgi:hypothetical protein
MGRYDPFWPYLSVHVHFPHRYPLLSSCHYKQFIQSISLSMAQVIVVGGGLAGLSAAHTLLERGANVLLLDKQGCVSFCFFSPDTFVDSPLSLSGSWVVILPRLRPASMALAPRLSRTMASQTLRRFSSKIPNIQCVFSGSCLLTKG